MCKKSWFCQFFLHLIGFFYFCIKNFIEVEAITNCLLSINNFWFHIIQIRDFCNASSLTSFSSALFITVKIKKDSHYILSIDEGWKTQYNLLKKFTEATLFFWAEKVGNALKGFCESSEKYAWDSHTFYMLPATYIISTSAQPTLSTQSLITRGVHRGKHPKDIVSNLNTDP